jgi:hypothetical protein
MSFGDEFGIFWNTPPRVARGQGPRVQRFDASAITVHSDWTAPSEFPNLDGPVAIDLETEDPLLKTVGPDQVWEFAWGRGQGGWGGSRRQGRPVVFPYPA